MQTAPASYVVAVRQLSVMFAAGIATSLIADARDPDVEERRRERAEKADAMRGGGYSRPTS